MISNNLNIILFRNSFVSEKQQIITSTFAKNKFVIAVKL